MVTLVAMPLEPEVPAASALSDGVRRDIAVACQQKASVNRCHNL